MDTSDYAKLKYLNIVKLLCLGQYLVQRGDDSILISIHSSLIDYWMAKEPACVMKYFIIMAE